MPRLGIRQKIIIFISCVALISLAAGILFVNQIQQNAAYKDRIIGQDMAILRSTQQALSAANSTSFLVQEVLFSAGPADSEEVDEKIESFKKSVFNFQLFIKVLTWGSETQSFKKCDGGIFYREWAARGFNTRLQIDPPAEEIRQLAGLADIYFEAANRYRLKVMEQVKSRREVKEAASPGQDLFIDVSDEMAKALQYTDEGKQALTKLTDVSEKNTENSMLNLEKFQRKTYTLVFLILLGMFIFQTAAVWLFCTWVVAKPLKELSAGVRQLEQGDRTVQLKIKTGDEFQEVAEDFNKMVAQLNETTVSRDALLREMEERKRLENVVLQSEKMAAVGQLAAGIAHEINNPLGVILGFAQGLSKRIPLNDPFEKPLQSIERESLRCKSLVQDLLKFSRKSGLEKEPINLNQTIETALSLIMAQARVRNIQVRTEFQQNLPPVLANFNQIQQVIVNLAANAFDAMKPGGKLAVKTAVEGGPEKGFCRIEISDNGEGIALEIQPKIFDPFFTTKAVGKGTGLGLSLAYEIIQKHSGQIRMESAAGKGTTFFILLPMSS